jgi:hypothetical protein
VTEAEDIHLVARVKKVGNSLAIFIPAEEARRAGIVEGQTIAADIHAHAPDVFGLLKGKIKGAFTRRDLWDE